MNELQIRTPLVIGAEINGIKDQARKFFLQSSIEIGQRLVEAKALLPHGEWGEWLEKTVDYSQSTANNLMKLYHEYGSNSQAFEKLNYTQAVALLGVPSEDREEFIKENDISDLSTRQLTKLIKDKQKEKELLEKQLQESEEKAAKEQEARERISNQFTELEQKSKEAADEILRLREVLQHTQESGTDDEVEKLQSELEKITSRSEEYQKQIKKLEKELREKPIDVPAIVERIPEEVEKELLELRKKVQAEPTVVEVVPESIEQELIELRKKANQNDNVLHVRFSFTFNELVRGFQDLLGCITEMEESGLAEIEKYRKAVIGLTDQMANRVKVEQEPAAEQGPAVEQEPAAEQGPAVEQEPAVEQGPAVEQEPAAEQGPAVEQEPAVEQGPAVEQEPAAEQGAAVEQEPAQSKNQRKKK